MGKIFMFCLLFCASLNAQSSRCHNIYVWEFTDQDDQKNSFTKDLTNAVEEALVNLSECTVLQRRKFASLQAQVQNETNIQSVRDIKTLLANNLTTNGAELVLFGTVNIISRKEYELQLRIESLRSTKIIRMKSIDIQITDLVDNTLKKALVEEVVRSLIGTKKEREISDLTPINIIERDGLFFELLRCDQVGTDIVLKAKVTNKVGDSAFGVKFRSSKSRIILDDGKEYALVEAKLADKFGTNKVQGFSKDIFKDIPIEVSLTFKGLPHGIKKIVKLELSALHKGYSFDIEMRDILVR